MKLGRRRSLFARPLLGTLVLGCTVSLVASGRLSVRLIADGALSFLFLPICAIAGFAVVYHGSRNRPAAFDRALDDFLAGQWPWLLWLIALASISVIVPARRLGPWLLPLVLSLAVPIAWSTILDFRFFRTVMARAARAAVRDVLVYRVLAWGAAVTYFLGIALWADAAPRVSEWWGR